MSAGPEAPPPVIHAGRIGSRLLRWLTVLGLALVFAGCASQQAKVSESADPSPVDTDANGAPQWHYLQFRFARPSPELTDRYLDLLVASEVLAPLLVEYRDRLTLWRFHRRWPNDPTGHQFSWIVRATPQTVAQLDTRIRSSAALTELESRGHLREYRVRVANVADPGALSATSDRAWPDVLQREWPYFIMGASRMWLGLVQAEAARVGTSDLHARYREASDAVETLWFDEGNHALFHHLSALFGYRPLRVIRRDIMTF
jgi:hypothetical protein